MKLPRFLIITLLLIVIRYAPAGTLHCTWNFADFTGGALGIKQVQIQTIAPYGVDGSTIITGDVRAYGTGTNSALTISNLFNGRSYRVKFFGDARVFGTNWVTTVTNNFGTNVTGLVNAVDYLSLPLITDSAAVAYSQAGADARFLRRSNDFTTNLTLLGTTTFPGTGVSNYVWTATNATGAGYWRAASAPESISTALLDGSLFSGIGGIDTILANGPNLTGAPAVGVQVTDDNDLFANVYPLSDFYGTGAGMTAIPAGDVTMAELQSATNSATLATQLELAARTNTASLAQNLSATFQPLDSDLTAIAALTTTAYGRAILALANQAALVALFPGDVVTNGYSPELTLSNLLYLANANGKIGFTNSGNGNLALTQGDGSTNASLSLSNLLLSGTLKFGNISQPVVIEPGNSILNFKQNNSYIATLRYNGGDAFSLICDAKLGWDTSATGSGVVGQPTTYLVTNGLGTIEVHTNLITLGTLTANGGITFGDFFFNTNAATGTWMLYTNGILTESNATTAKWMQMSPNGLTGSNYLSAMAATGLVISNFSRLWIPNGLLNLGSDGNQGAFSQTQVILSSDGMFRFRDRSLIAGGPPSSSRDVVLIAPSDTATRSVALGFAPINRNTVSPSSPTTYNNISNMIPYLVGSTNGGASITVTTMGVSNANLIINGQVLATNITGMTNSKAVIVDGGIHLPSALFGGSYATARGTNYYGGGIHFWDHGTAFPPPSDSGVSYTPGMSLKYDSDWGGSDTGLQTSRWGKWTGPNLRIEPGYGWGYGQLQLLNEDATCALGINWSRGPRNVEYNTALNYLLGQPVQFQVDYTDANTNHYRAGPGLIGASVAVNAPYQSSGTRMGQLWVQSLAPEVSASGYQQNGTYAVNHNVVHVFGTNGSLSIGRQMNLLGTAYADDTTVAIDFAKDRFTRYRLSSNTTFTVTGLTPESIWHTNLVYHRTLVLESGATAKTLTWPAEVTWVNEAGTATPPASVAASNLMEVTLRGYYDGITTNVLASYASGSNKTLVDADLASFLQRASITDATQVDALQYLTYSLKRSGLWNNLHVIYPLVGGNSNAHAMNLRSNACNIAFTSAGVTHDANGITGNASSGSGDTGYKFNYAGADTNALIAVYSRTQTPTASGRFASVTDGSSRMGLYRNSAAIGFDGPMNNTTGSGINTSTDFRGFMALSRTNSNDYFDAWRSTVTERSAASVGTIANNLFLLARNSPPAGFYSDVNLAFVCAGKGITPTQYTNLLNIVNRYQTILGRNVP